MYVGKKVKFPFRQSGCRRESIKRSVHLRKFPSQLYRFLPLYTFKQGHTAFLVRLKAEVESRPMSQSGNFLEQNVKKTGNKCSLENKLPENKIFLSVFLILLSFYLLLEQHFGNPKFFPELFLTKF